MRNKKNKEKFGYLLKIKMSKKEGHKNHEYWHRVDGLFPSVHLAREYAQKNFLGKKSHIEGVRLDTKPVVWQK